MGRADTVKAAAANNAGWCHAVCGVNGVVGSFATGLWASAVRTPHLYPDAVTLDPSTSVATVLGAIDCSVGASVKDSFATLDLSQHGFGVLFAAEWLSWESVPVTGGEASWRRVALPEELRAWTSEHGEDPPFVPQLLNDPRVCLLQGGRRGTPVGVALFAAGGVVGVSNLFVADGAADSRLWFSVLDECARRYPGWPVVTFEHGQELVAAVGAGARRCGPLRVWLNEA